MRSPHAALRCTSTHPPPNPNNTQEGGRNTTSTHPPLIPNNTQEGGRLLAETDALLALAQVAADKGWTRPTLLQPPPPPEAAAQSAGREGEQQQQEGQRPSASAASSSCWGPRLRCIGLRHPVVEAALPSGAGSYIPNTVELAVPLTTEAAEAGEGMDGWDSLGRSFTMMRVNE